VILLLAVKLIGKLQDGTVFFKKGQDDSELFEFKTDEGKFHCGSFPSHLILCFFKTCL
jgi:hypothetical protein